VLVVFMRFTDFGDAGMWLDGALRQCNSWTSANAGSVGRWTWAEQSSAWAHLMARASAECAKKFSVLLEVAMPAARRHARRRTRTVRA
jgi:hypothetical protein